MLRVSAILVALSTPVAAQDFFTLKGHGGPIMDIAVSSSGRIASASFDNAVGAWTGRTPNWLDGHEAAVTTVAFLDEDTILSGSDDFTLRAWQDGQNKVLGEHQAKILGIAVSPDQQLIATASWDATIGVWPASDPSNVRFFEGHRQGVNDVAFSPDGRLLYSASTDGTIRIWDVESGEETEQLVSHGFGVNQLIVDPSGKWLAYGALDGGTRVIDLETGKAVADFTLDRRPILAMAYDQQTGQLAVGDGEGFIMVIDMKQLQITRDFRATLNGPIWALAFSKDGQNILAGGIEDIVYSWPVASLDEHGQMSGTTQSFLKDPETMSNGERQFQRKCSICHALSEGSARKAGPSLYDLFGRRAGTVADYSYSPVLDGSEIVWTEETINDLFDQGPDHYIPGSKMPMQVIAKAQDRTDLIDYLRTATAKGRN